MCGLIFCPDATRWPELVAANLARAGRNKGAFTFTEWRRGWTQVEMLDHWREVPVTSADMVVPGVTHLQAPTSSASKPHPAVTPANTMVWHNGLFQPSAMLQMQAILGSAAQWDTMLIAEAVERGFDSPDFKCLGHVSGSFACIAYVGGELYAFRNAIAPLYVGEDGATLSSVPAPGVTKELEAGVVWVFSEGNQWEKTPYGFEISHNPYGI